ncbi:hypothetical protein [Streptomyces sp. NEAU-NA10]|uniref:hypothetical protein n=1 Tax=Streptomyces sp. NEAU-NA10 TaxID=3416050 RepID=UPI003CC6255F
MPQLPEDIIDRLTQMERRIQQLSTAVNGLPALNKGSGEGGYLSVRAPRKATGEEGAEVFRVGKWDRDEFGLAIRRQTGTFALSLYNGNGTATALQPLRIYDSAGREIISDDIANGGLARPWLAMLPPQDTGQARWPQTSSTSWTTIAVSHNPVWQPKMRLWLNTRVSSGATGQVRVLVNGSQWGPTVTAPTDFDHTDVITADFASAYTTLLKVEIQAIVTSTSGTVHATPILMHGRQS